MKIASAPLIRLRAFCLRTLLARRLNRQTCPALTAPKHQQAVCRQRNTGRGRQTIPARSVDRDAARIALRVRVEPLVVGVAVENFVPVAGAGESDE